MRQSASLRPLAVQAPKAAPVPAIDTTTNQEAAAGEAWESPREYANDYWKSPTCPFDVSDLLGDEAPKAAPKLEIASSTDLEVQFASYLRSVLTLILFLLCALPSSICISFRSLLCAHFF